MLTDEIISNWNTGVEEHIFVIRSLDDLGYPAWTYKVQGKCGVAIRVDNETDVSESFAGAELYSDFLILRDTGEKQKYLMLLTDDLESKKIPFATLCAEFISPGSNGELRKELIENPVNWWIQWKELLGNKNVDERVYDVLGELCTLKYLEQIGECPVWRGPDGATFDLDCDSTYYEVKSSIARKKRQITLSNHFQLDPPAGKALKLVFCQFEPSQSGYSIDGLVEDLAMCGYTKFELNRKLESLGFKVGQSARKRCYALHAMIIYNVDENFPAIRESSFIGGKLPDGVQSITYTVSLDSVEGERIVEQ